MPVEDFLAVIKLVEQAAERNNDHRIKGFYVKILDNLAKAWRENQE